MMDSTAFLLIITLIVCSCSISCAYIQDEIELSRRHFNTYIHQNPVVSESSRNKVDTLGPILKRHVEDLRRTNNKKIDIIFLVDSSASVGPDNFVDEIKFIRKLLSDFTVDTDHTRLSVITFSSRSKVLNQIDYISETGRDKNKCSLLEEDLPRIRYRGGATYTLGAFLMAKEVLKKSRPDAAKAVFLITDGFSNSGDPRPQAEILKRNGVKIFTIGIKNGNVRELLDMASEPKNETCYILESFEEFEALARRALHEDLRLGSYIPQHRSKCSHLCLEREDCCDSNATCRCGTHSGHFECVCQRGHYGTGLVNGCHPCPSGTYKRKRRPGDVMSCTACPDKNHISRPGATDKSDCFCKKGYRTLNGTGCAALLCPLLIPPENGYFVNDKCNNVFNAACGMKCNAGYELRGSSLRICEEHGIWSGNDTECIMKTCPALPQPKNGHMICSNDAFTFSTVCRFTCDDGFKLVGSRKRECLAIAVWTGLPTRCREITCRPLPEVRDGNVYPAMCTGEEVTFGTTCQIACHPGYSLIGPPMKQCTPDGMWSPSTNGTMSRCEDTQPPYLTCPMNIETEVGEDDSAAEVNWNVPLALDNSGFLPLITVVPVVEPPKRFPIGLNVIKYVAQDTNQNIAECTFHVKVNDFISPTIDSCFSPPPFISSKLYANITWEEPIFSDNSGETVTVQRSHEPGLFRQGETTVVYTGFDESGNNNTCEIVIKVIQHPCQYPPAPVNGFRECRETQNGVYCHATCMEGYDFALKPAEEYFCANDNIWRPEDKMPIPECSAISAANDIHQPASITYLGNIECRREKALVEIKQSFKRKMSRRVNDLCDDRFFCHIDSIGTTCEEIEDFNKIRVVLGRNKRSTRENQIPRGSGKPESILTFDFSIKGRVSKRRGATANFMQQDALTDSLSSIVKNLEQDANSGVLDLEMNGKKVQVANMTFKKSGPKYDCTAGSVLVGTSCLKCPRGTYFDVITRRCESCQEGTYQPNIGQITCVVCPTNTSTGQNSSKSQQECRALCLPGTFSPDGLERCATCPKGTYQNQYGTTYCEECPPNTSTNRRGARQPRRCKTLCSPGYVSKSGLEPCYPCPRGTYQPEIGQSSCYKCPGSSLTTSSASSQLSDCNGDWDMQADASDDFLQSPVEVNDCFENKCQNGATCEPGEDFAFDCICAPGFEGIYCEIKTDGCEGEPCLHGGTCRDLDVEYSCNCADGYTGKKCEINIDECVSSPCENNATCIDEVNGFICSCADGYAGTLCAELLNSCKGNPCQNLGQCRNEVDGYTCECPTGFSGADCEINEDECASSPCMNGAQCMDGAGFFTCNCELGYEGKICDVDIDDCLPSPCANGSTCQDRPNGFVCHCVSGYTGVKCDTELETNYLLEFHNSGVYNYSQMAIDQDLTALTAAFWMKTDDAINQGTPFSYSVGDKHNALTLTDYEGFVFYINNKKQTTDVEANDGGWHHIVVTWSSNRGSWKIYLDTLLWDQGFDLAAGESIKGGGTFIVGQEQDPSGLSPSESFVGKITQLNVWSEELSLARIESLRTSCDKFYGDVIAWPDVQSGMQGTLTSEPANFCRDCPVPVSPTYGEVHVESTAPGSILTYSCLRGFYVSGDDSSQCLITGEWEMLDEPSCERVDCRNPGDIPNGYRMHRTFTYDSRVSYRCHKGYRLVGDSLYCNADGQWEGIRPKCEEITCELPELSENTRVSDPSKIFYSPREVAHFSCTEGNRLFTDYDDVECQADGTWEKSVPTCDPQKCRKPKPVDNAEMSEELIEYSVGFILRYTCDFGFTLSQNSSNPSGRLKCLNSGEWEDNYPKCVVINCNDPPNIQYGRAIFSDTAFLSTVRYECNSGYILDGEDILECSFTGLWDMEPPICIPVDCREPDQIVNGIIKVASYSYNSIATYQCNGGYELQGNERRTCLADSSWSSTVPICNPKSCGIPNGIENGNFTGNDFTFKNTVSYFCDEGFEISGGTTRDCRQDGQWTPLGASCSRRRCVSPPKIRNAFLPNNEHYFGDSIIYQCNSGYRINGTNEIHCTYDGSWSEVNVACNPIECGPLDNLRNGRINVLGVTYTSKAEYECEEGYDLEGDAVRICQADGSWSGSSAFCRGLKCQPPNVIQNGHIDFKELKLGSVVLYVCNDGFKLVGNNVRRCLPNLTWSDSEPQCVGSECPEPIDIANGRKIVASLQYDSVVRYECDTGYNLKGNEEARCTSTKAWSSEAPICEQILCETPATVTSNGRMFGTDFSYGGVIHYVCDPGYRLNGAENRTCLITGEWDHPIPICEIVHCHRLRVLNGFTSGFSTEYSTRLVITCKRSHVLFGASERTCLPNGTWSGQNSVCVKCSEPPPVTFGTITINQGVATYKCNAGYTLQGLSRYSCQIDGSWFPASPPVCSLRGCDDLNITTFHHGTVNVDSMTAGGTATYTCDPGYILIGVSSRRCLSDGRWNGDMPNCAIRRCAELEWKHGNIAGFGNTFGTIIKFACGDGSILVGNSEITCESDGNWSGQTPTCELVTCPEPIVIDNGHITVQNVSYGSVIAYNCNTGYEIVGDATRICLKTGAWSGIVPQCTKITCPPINNVQNGKVKLVNDGFSLGAQVRYECNLGYVLEGLPFRMCLFNKQWSGAEPVCNKVRCRRPRPPFNGKNVGGNGTYFFEDRVEVVCNEGFELTIGTRFRTCSANRRWSLPFPRCSIVSCGDPPTKPKARTILLNGTANYGGMISVSCIDGHRDELNSVVYSRCESNGIWSAFSIECSRIQCGSLPEIENGRIIGSGLHFGDVVTVACDTGYIVNGESRLLCGIEGSWSQSAMPVCNIVTCGSPSLPENGIIQGSSFTFNSSITFLCNKGHVLNGNSIATCQADGTWSGITPFCRLITCSEPDFISDGNVVVNEMFFGSVVTYSCSEGFTLSGNASRTCLETGAWSGLTPKCTKVACPPIYSVPNGQVVSEGFFLGDKISYRCNSGYVLEGLPFRLCLFNKQWSGAEPVCNKVQCRRPRPPPNGKNVGGNGTYFFEDRVEVVCNEGFELTEGTQFRTCSANRRWSLPFPRCTIVSCGDPPTKLNARTILLNGTANYGGMISVSCIDGHRDELNSVVYSRCESNGIWSAFNIECSRIQCGSLPEIENGRIIGSGLHFGDVVTVACDTGYIVNGESRLLCGIEGSWSQSTMPVCNIVTCGSPSLPENGIIQGSSFTFNSSITFLCNKGHVLNGNSIAKCQADGTWSGKTPFCSLITCSEPDFITDGNVVVNEMFYGSVVTYTCSEGFTISGNASRTCLETGAWSDFTPKCTKVACPPVYSVPNGQVVSEGFFLGDKISYRCNSGYVLEGLPFRLCLFNKQWSGAEPVCNKVRCRRPRPPFNGKNVGGNGTYFFEDKVEVVCNEGFELTVGTRFRTCSASRRWSLPFPRCTTISCGDPPTKPNARTILLNGTANYGGMISVSCIDGHRDELNSVVYSRCESNGLWSAFSIECSRIQCGSLPDIENGRIIGSGLHFGDVVTVACDTGYIVNGESRLLCGIEGSWSSSTMPACNIVTCGSPSLPENGNIQGSSFTFNSSITFLCNKGHILNGNSIATCQADGTWSGITPFCRLITCSEPDKIADGNAVANETDYGSVVIYSCNNGFTISGNASRTCLETGVWSGISPKCTKVTCPPINSVQNGKVILVNEGFTLGAKVTYQCNSGYVLEGLPFRLCLFNKQWSGAEPVCNKVRCRRPRPPINGKNVGGNGTYFFEDRVEVICNEGFELTEGTKFRTCRANRRWSIPFPICTIVSCGDPPTKPNARTILLNGTANYGGMISVSCTDGHRDKPNSVVYSHCESNGTWSSLRINCSPVQCDQSLEIENGRTIGSGFQFGETVSIECDLGYILSGDDEYSCSKDGIWIANVNPTCNIVTCGSPIVPENGKVQGSNNTFGSYIIFSCDIGYNLIGSNYSECQTNGIWSGIIPSCDIVVCSEPAKMENGHIEVSNTSYGSVITYSCEKGYELIGESFRTCLESGKWSAEIPSCSKILCPPVTELTNGRVIGNANPLSANTIGATIRYECNPGYVLEGIPFRLCLFSKMWSGTHPKCNKVRCRPPRPPTNGQILGPRGTAFFGDRVQIMCNEGYELTTGDQFRTCQANRRWSLPFPQCTMINCGDPPTKANAVSTLQNTTTNYRDMVSVSCGDGYKDMSKSIVYSTCQANKTWSQFSIECLPIHCNASLEIPNGRFKGSGFQFNDVITVECDEGYQLIGDSELRCVGVGTWSASIFPTCNIISCTSGLTIENGEISGDQFTFGSTLTYTCTGGYFLVGDSRRTCQSNGLWSGAEPRCSIRLCSSPGTIFRGSLVTAQEEFRVGDYAVYQCDDGYTVVGPNDMICSEDGTWTGTLPSCDRITCSRPAEIYSGRVTYSNTHYQSTAVYTCKTGFDIFGESILTCTESGVWDHSAPECRPKDCGYPTPVANSGVLGDLYTFGNIVTYFCEDGYSIVGIDVLVCMDDGTWSNDPPECVPISCGSPPEIENSIRSGDNYKFKDQVYYACADGYEISGNNVLRCADNSIWVGEQPICQPVNCGPPPVLQYSTTFATTTTFGSEVTYMCNPGYWLQGDSKVSCSHDGSWNIGENVACLPVDCGAPPPILYGRLEASVTTFPSAAQYFCSDGYSLIGDSILACNERGVWRGTPPSCLPRSCGQPAISDNTIIIGGDYSFGQTVVFNCPDGYFLKGEGTSTCLASGLWSSTSPTCQAVSCESLSVNGEHIRVLDGSPSHSVYQESVRLACAEGYVIDGEALLRCTASGRWSAAVPNCIPVNIEVCPELSYIPHGQPVKAANRVGQTATVSCNPGFRAAGDMTVTCLSSTKWSRPAGYCRRVVCGKPRVTDMVNVIRIRGRSYHYGSKIRFWCRPGIRPIRMPPIITCLASGNWDGEIACSLPCKGGCRNGGRCLGLRGCKCPRGYGGRRCQRAKCILPCLHGGKCSAPYKCTCKPGYEGRRCQKPICSQPCQNGGRCIRPNRCHCQHGYQKPFCHSRSKTRTLPPSWPIPTTVQTFTLPKVFTTPKPIVQTTETESPTTVQTFTLPKVFTTPKPIVQTTESESQTTTADVTTSLELTTAVSTSEELTTQESSTVTTQELIPITSRRRARLPPPSK